MQVVAFFETRVVIFEELTGLTRAPMTLSVGVNSLVRVQAAQMLTSRLSPLARSLTHPLPSRPSLVHLPSR